MHFSRQSLCAGRKLKWGIISPAFLLLVATLISSYPVAGLAQNNNDTVELTDSRKLEKNQYPQQPAKQQIVHPKKLTRLELLKIAQQKSPNDPNLASQLATAYIKLARGQSNPEYYQLANKVIAPWTSGQNLPGMKKKPISNELRLVRATLAQHTHHYRQASDDLLHIIRKQPKNVQAWLTLSTIQLVQSDYSKAQVSCSALSRISSNWLANLCYSQIYAFTGSTERAYAMQQSLLEQLKGQQPELGLWVTGLLAENAVRMGHDLQAEKHFQDALKIKADDTYILRTYSDSLLMQDRTNDVIQLLEKRTDDDQLLLRLAMAIKKTGNTNQQKQLVEMLKFRYKNALMSHGHTHGRDEALFLMEFKSDDKASLEKALQLALTNWKNQKEPDDALILLRAAKLLKQPEKEEIVLNWIKKNRLQDVRLVKFETYKTAEIVK